MRHHAENVAALTKHSGDIFERAVRVCSGANLTCGSRVAEGDTVFGLQLCQSIGVAEIVAFHVTDRHLENLAAANLLGEGRVSGLGSEMDLLADVVLSGVAHER